MLGENLAGRSLYPGFTRLFLTSFMYLLCQANLLNPYTGGGVWRLSILRGSTGASNNRGFDCPKELVSKFSHLSQSISGSTAKSSRRGVCKTTYPGCCRPRSSQRDGSSHQRAQVGPQRTVMKSITSSRAGITLVANSSASIGLIFYMNLRVGPDITRKFFGNHRAPGGGVMNPFLFKLHRSDFIMRQNYLEN